MKRIFLFTLMTIIFISCEKEVIENESFANKATNEQIRPQKDLNLKKGNLSVYQGMRCADMEKFVNTELSNRNTCNIISVDPFTSSTVTYGYICEDYPTYGCFPENLETYVEQEILLHGGITTRTKGFVANGGIFLTLSDIIDTSNLYPYISSLNANLVYEEISCQILNNLDNLPPLPSTQKYTVDITYMLVDYPLCGGPPATIIDLHYKIYKLGNP